MRWFPTFVIVLIGIALTACVSTSRAHRQASLERAIDRIAELKCVEQYSEALKVSALAEDRFGPSDAHSSLAPVWFLLYVQRSALLEKMGDASAAESEALRSISFHAGGYVYAARLYRRLGKTDKAIAILKDAVVDPRVREDAKLLAEVHFINAQCLFEVGDVAGSITECNNALDSADEIYQTLRKDIELFRSKAEREVSGKSGSALEK